MEIKHFNLFYPFKIEEETQIYQIRKEIKRFAKINLFTPEFEGKIILIINELASNILKHAKTGGEILLRFTITEKQNFSAEIIGVDNGIGIRNLQLALTDGFSTANSAGNGLSAVKRLSENFDIFSKKDSGVIVYSQIFSASKNKKKKKNQLQIDALLVAKENEEYCGDYYKIIEKENLYYIIAIDGLGHGFKAYTASQKAADIFANNFELNFSEIFEKINSGLSGLNGCVAALVKLDLTVKKIWYSGIGNISAKLVNDTESKNFMSPTGFIGNNNTTNNYYEITDNLPDDFIMLINSDGVSSRCNTDLNKNGLNNISMNELLNKHPMIIAALIYKTYNKKNDDSLIMIIWKKIITEK